MLKLGSLSQSGLGWNGRRGREVVAWETAGSEGARREAGRGSRSNREESAWQGRERIDISRWSCHRAEWGNKSTIDLNSHVDMVTHISNNTFVLDES